MLYEIICGMLAFYAVLLGMFFLALVSFKVSLIFSYWFVWTDHERKTICPDGLWRAVFYDE